MNLKQVFVVDRVHVAFPIKYAKLSLGPSKGKYKEREHLLNIWLIYLGNHLTLVIGKSEKKQYQLIINKKLYELLNELTLNLRIPNSILTLSIIFVLLI